MSKYLDSLHKSLEFAFRHAEITKDYSEVNELTAEIKATRTKMDASRKQKLLLEEGENELVSSMLSSIKNPHAILMHTPKGLTIHTRQRVDDEDNNKSICTLGGSICVPNVFTENRRQPNAVTHGTEDGENRERKCAAAYSDRCGAGNYIKGTILHYCFICKFPMHGGVCGTLICELTSATKRKFTHLDLEDAPGSSILCKSCLIHLNIED
jgi:hypothetical protein